MDIILDEGTITLILQNSAIGASFVVVFVAAIKALAAGFNREVNPQHVTLVTTLVLMIVMWGARIVGRADLLDNALAWGEQILPALVNFVLVVIGAPALYHAGKAVNAPVVSYKPDLPQG